jgi:hypothetical protein
MYTTLRGDKYHAGYNLLQPGHIILTTDKKKLTSLLIPGEWTHAALCISRGPKLTADSTKGTTMAVFKTPPEVAEMTHTNFTFSHFFDICKEADRVCLLEAPGWTKEYTQAVIAKCLSLKDARYDVEFELGVEALYCSELIYQSDFERTLELDLTDIVGLDREYISPDGIAACKKLRVVWDSAT